MGRVNGDEISKASLAAPGLMLLVAGLVGIAFSEQAADKLETLAGSYSGGALPCLACMIAFTF